MSTYRGHGLWVIWVSFLLGLILQVMPWPEDLYIFRPSWLVLLLMYWVMALPHRVSVGTSFVLGLVWDLVVGSPLGIRGLTLMFITYVVAFKHQLLRNLALWQQALVVVVLTLVMDVVLFWLDFLVTGQAFQPAILWNSLVNGLLWPWLFLLMRKIRRQFTVK